MSNDDLYEEFEELTKPIIHFINKNFHPHTQIVIDSTSAQVLEGIMSYCNFEYID